VERASPGKSVLSKGRGFSMGKEGKPHKPPREQFPMHPVAFDFY